MLHQSTREHKPFDLLAFLQRQDVQQWILAGLIVGIGFLILRKSKAAPGIAAAVSMLGSAFSQEENPMESMASFPDQSKLIDSLKEIASQTDLLTPTELWSALQTKGVCFVIPQQMGHTLSSVGLQSHIRTVPGRSDRRWYDLATWSRHEDQHAA